MDLMFLLIRLPFFFVGLLLLSGIVAFIVPIAAFVWFGIFFPFKLVVGLPLSILSSAFSNENRLSEYMDDLIEYFWEMPLGFLGNVGSFYKGLFDWTFQGSPHW